MPANTDPAIKSLAERFMKNRPAMQERAAKAAEEAAAKKAADEARRAEAAEARAEKKSRVRNIPEPHGTKKKRFTNGGRGTAL